MLAGLEPAGVLVEILNPDGSMARRPELEVFAREHGLKMGSIADLIAYRRPPKRLLNAWTSATSTPNSARSSW